MTTTMTLPVLRGLRSTAFLQRNAQKRNMFYWLTVVFNRFDEDRVKEVGPDRACAEWLLRNGASVRWQGSKDVMTDYNILGRDQTSPYIEGVIAVDAGINYVGFVHFEGCKYIKDIKLQECRYIDDKALPMLSYLKDSLSDLELIDCSSITEKGLHSLKCLKNLKNLTLAKLAGVDDKPKVEKELKSMLPDCNIKFV